MISTAQGLEDALSFVTEQQDSFVRTVSADMDASEMNSIFEEMEERINLLYQKIRTLEDIKNYIQEFVSRNIEERRKKIISRLRVIEMATDDFQSTDNISVPISFDNVTRDIRDRDGTVIDALVAEDATLVMPNKSQSRENLLSITNKTPQIDAQPYNEKILGGVLIQPFRSVYESKQPVSGGLTVTYELMFNTKTNCNYFNLAPVNCTITKVVLTSFNGDTQEIDPSEHYFSPNTDIQSALITINCTTYDRVVVAYPINTEDDSFDKSITGSEMIHVE